MGVADVDCGGGMLLLPEDPVDVESFVGNWEVAGGSTWVRAPDCCDASVENKKVKWR
jgi:hypothetical protein